MKDWSQLGLEFCQAGTRKEHSSQTLDLQDTHDGLWINRKGMNGDRRG